MPVLVGPCMADRDICHPKTGDSNPFWQLDFHTPALDECPRQRSLGEHQRHELLREPLVLAQHLPAEEEETADGRTLLRLKHRSNLLA